MAEEYTLTAPGSHVATHRGYASGTIIEPGDPVPAGIAVADEWMAAVPPADPALVESDPA